MMMLNTKLGVALLAFFSTSGCGLSSSMSAAAAAAPDDKNGNNQVYRKRNLRKQGNRNSRHQQHIVTNKQHDKNADDITEDVAFFTRMLQNSVPIPGSTPNPTPRPQTQAVVTPSPQAQAVVTPSPQTQAVVTPSPQAQAVVTPPPNPFPTLPPQTAQTDPPQSGSTFPPNPAPTFPPNPAPTFPPQSAATDPPQSAPTPSGGPVALDDEETMNADEGATFVSVLENDTPVPGEDLGVTAITSQASSGSCTVGINLDEVVYAPNVGFVGTDSCVYEACDKVPVCDTATVTIEVTASLMVAQWMSLNLD